jgi:hypothetical protein
MWGDKKKEGKISEKLALSTHLIKMLAIATVHDRYAN